MPHARPCVTTLNLVMICYMDASRPIPRFLFAYVQRRPRSAEDLPSAIRRQLVHIRRYLSASGLSEGRTFLATPTYRGRTFLQHPAFDQAVTYARDNDVPLLVGDLGDLMSRIPPDRFLASADRLRALEVDVMDALTGASARSLSLKKWRSLYAVAIDRHRSTAAIRFGKRVGRKPSAATAGSRSAGAMANKKRAEKQAELIWPVVMEMEAALPTGEKLSPSALMRRLNELGIKGPNSATWNRMAAGRYLRAIRAADAPSPD